MSRAGADEREADPNMLQVFFQRWYAFSKTSAENCCQEILNENDIDLIVMNPAMCIGPLLQPELNSGVASILNLINGNFYLLIKFSALQAFIICFICIGII